MEYLGDDMMSVGVGQSVNALQNEQVASTVGKLHSAFWNSAELQAAPQTLTRDEIVMMLLSLMGNAEVGAKYADTTIRELGGDKIAE